MDKADEAQHHLEVAMDQAAAARRARQDLKSCVPVINECIECGDDIPKARIKAVPGVERCIHCQQFYEMTNR